MLFYVTHRGLSVLISFLGYVKNYSTPSNMWFSNLDHICVLTSCFSSYCRTVLFSLARKFCGKCTYLFDSGAHRCIGDQPQTAHLTTWCNHAKKSVHITTKTLFLHTFYAMQLKCTSMCKTVCSFTSHTTVTRACKNLLTSFGSCLCELCWVLKLDFFPLGEMWYWSWFHWGLPACQ